MTATLAFLDTETVTLDPGSDVIWEIAVILRAPATRDVEWVWQMRPNMAKANPSALEINRFADRYAVPAGVEALGWGPYNDDPAQLDQASLAKVLQTLLKDVVVVGSSPWFDTERLALFLRTFGVEPSWHHRLVDVKAFAAGWLYGNEAMSALVNDSAAQAGPEPPWSPDLLADELGVSLPAGEERHTALGDARFALRMYDAVTGGAR